MDVVCCTPPAPTIHGGNSHDIRGVRNASYIHTYIHTHTSNEHFIRLQAILNRAERWGLTSGTALPSVKQLSQEADNTLFTGVVSSRAHDMESLLPPQQRALPYELRNRAHNFELPRNTTTLSTMNF